MFDPARRRVVLLAAMAFPTFSACEAKPMTVTLDVVLFSYLDRPIFDVVLSGTDIGVAGAWPFSGRGSMSGVQLPLGPQELSWRLDGPKGMPRNGETIAAKNQPELKNVPKEAAFLGVHIYPDETVELVPSPHFPELSERGQAFDREWRRSHGK